MLRYLSLMASILMLLTSSNSLSLAQEARTQSAVLADIQQSVIRAVGAQKGTVEVAVAGNIVIVTASTVIYKSTHGDVTTKQQRLQTLYRRHSWEGPTSKV
jgi:hypothetical protein